MYQIIQNFIKYNRSGQVLNPQGIVLHDTADPGATDENEQKYFDSADRQASAHAFVDWDSIIQTIPFDEVAWHAGPTANHKFIGVELCHATNPDQFQEVWKRGVWLFAYVFKNVLKINTVTKDNLMSHAEVSNKWHETDHQDPVSYFAEYGKTIDDFRNDVQEAINLTVDEAKQILKDKFGLSDETITFLLCYKYGEDLLIKLAQNVKG